MFVFEPFINLKKRSALLIQYLTNAENYLEICTIDNTCIYYYPLYVLNTFENK